MRKYSEFYAPRDQIRLDADPVNPYRGQVWYNRATGKWMQYTNLGDVTADIQLTAGDEPTQGMIFSGMASSVTTYYKQFDSDITNSEIYKVTFGQMNHYPSTGTRNKYVSQVSTGTLNTGEVSGSFDYFDIDWVLHMYSTKACWSGDYNDFEIEFRSASNVSVFAIKISRESSYSHYLRYGASIATAVNLVSATGNRYFTDGELTFTPTQANFTKLTTATNNMNSFSFACDMASVTKIVLVRMRVVVSYNGGSGCAAQVRLWLKSNPKANSNMPHYCHNYFPMSGTIGTKLLNDGLYTDRDCVITNSTEVAGHVTNCTRFDATTRCSLEGYGVLSDTYNAISFFYRKFTPSTGTEYLLARGATGSTQAENFNSWRINEFMELESYMETGAGVGEVVGSGVFLKADGLFHHLLITVKAGEYIVRHDMAPPVTKVFTNSDTTSTRFTIGMNPDTSGDNYIGDLERIRVYVYTLTELMEEHLFSEPVLPVQYPMVTGNPNSAYSAQPNTLFPAGSNLATVSELVYT